MRLGGVIEAQVFQNLLDDGRVLDRGDDAHLAATSFALLHVDRKYVLQALGPGHGVLEAI